MNIPPELQQQTIALINSLVAYLIGRVAQHIGDTVDKRQKKWRVAKQEFEELFAEAYRRFFQQAPHLVEDKEIREKLGSPAIVDNLFRYAIGDLEDGQIPYAFPSPYDRLPQILSEIRSQGRSLDDNLVIQSLRNVRDTLRRVTRQLDTLSAEQAAQRGAIETGTDALAILAGYLDGQVTRPWEQHPSGDPVKGIPAIDRPFFEWAGDRLRETAERMEADRACFDWAEQVLGAIEAELSSKHAEWLSDDDPNRARGSERAASACLGFVHLQRGTIKFERREYAAAAELYGRAVGHAAAGRDPELTARALYQQGAAFGEAGNHPRAEQAFRGSLKLNDTPRGRFNLGVTLHQQARRREAMPEYQQALASFRTLAQAEPGAYLPDVAMTLNNLGVLLTDLGERPQAREHHEEALRIYRKLAEAEPGAYLPNVAATLNNLGVLLKHLGERAQAREHYEEALRIYRKLAEAEPGAYLPDVAMTLNNLGILLANLGERPQAREHHEEALRIYRKLAEAEPGAYLPYLATTLNNVGVLLTDLGQRPQAREHHEEALRIRRKLAEAEPGAYLPDLAATLNNLGILLSDLGERAQAREHYEEALRIYRKLAEAEPGAYLPDLAMTLNNLGALLSGLGERPQAQEHYEEALRIYRKLAEAEPGAYLPDLATTLNNLGNLLRNLGERAQARKHYEEALTIRRKLAEAEPGAYLPDVAMTLNNLGNLLSDLGERAQARERYEEALRIYRKLAEAEPAVFVERFRAVVRNAALFAAKSDIAVDDWPALSDAKETLARLERNLAG